MPSPRARRPVASRASPSRNNKGRLTLSEALALSGVDDKDNDDSASTASSSTAAPNKEKRSRSYDQCHRTTCWKDRDLIKLRVCGGCRVARYCSTECQKQDWPNHKPACLMQQDARRVLTMPEIEGGLGSAEGEDLYRRLRIWLLKHQMNFGEALIDSLNLPMNPGAHERQGLYVTVTHIPDVPIEKCMKVESIKIIDLQVYASQGRPFSEYMEIRKRYERETSEIQEEVYGTGVVWVHIWHKGLSIGTRNLPVTFTKDHAGRPPYAQWEDKLRTKLCLGIPGQNHA